VEVAPKRATRSSKKSTTEEEFPILEKGHMYFFYKPKVEEDEVTKFAEVKRLYVVLTPGTVKETQEPEEKSTKKGRKSSPTKKKKVTEEEVKEESKEKEEMASQSTREDNLIKRLIIIGAKKMPNIEKHERLWGKVTLVTRSFKELDQELVGLEYETKTRGVRHQGPARAVAEGVYAILEHHRHTHLVYVLELPKELSEVQKAFNLDKEGSFILAVKNPDMMFKREGSKPKYPPKLANLFDQKRWIPANPPELLDHRGTEVLFIGAREDLKEEFGATGAKVEEMEKLEHYKINDDKLFMELRLNKAEIPTDPLHGKWK